MNNTFPAGAQSPVRILTPVIQSAKALRCVFFCACNKLWQAGYRHLRVAATLCGGKNLFPVCHPILTRVVDLNRTEDATMTTEPTSANGTPTFSEFQSAFKTLEKEDKFQIVYLMELLSRRPELADEVLARAEGGLQ